MFDRLENNPVRVEASLRRSGKNREKYKKFDGFRKAATSLKAHQVICFSLSCLNIDKQLTIFATFEKELSFHEWRGDLMEKKKKTIEMMDKDSTLFFPLSLPFSQLHLLFLMEFHT